MNKTLLNGLSKEQMLNVAEAIGITKSDIATNENGKITKSIILSEILSTMASLEVCEGVTFDEARINALANKKALDEAINYDIVEGIKLVVNEDELAISEVEEDDFNSKLPSDSLESNKFNVGTLDIDFFTEAMRSAIFAELKTINARYSKAKDYSVQPFTKLVEAMSELGLNGREVDFALSRLPQDIKESFDVKAIIQNDILSIIECYNEEENAKLQMFINKTMAEKAPSDKQLSFFNNVLEQAKERNYTTLIAEGKALKVNFSKSALDVKIFCDKVQFKLRQEPMSDGQESFLKSMNSLGMKLKYKGLTYGEASDLIAKNKPLFYRLNLVKTLNNFGFPTIDKTSIDNMSDERIAKISFALNKVGGIIKLVQQFTNENVFTLIETLNEKSNSQLLSIQTACITQDMNFVKKSLI